jgi:hypothetical protein
MYIRCVYIPKKLVPYQPLKIGKRYLCVGIEYNNYCRVVDEDGEPVLFSRRWFEKFAKYPKSWIRREYSDGEFFIYPPELSKQYFFAKWFDGDPATLKEFAAYIDSIKHSK